MTRLQLQKQITLHETALLNLQGASLEDEGLKAVLQHTEQKISVLKEQLRELLQ